MQPAAHEVATKRSFHPGERNFMKRICLIALCLVALAGTLFVSKAEPMLTLTIGPTWPQALLSTGVPSGDAGIEYGAMIDKKVAFGVAGDFLWNVQSKEERDSTHFRTISEQKTFMFPIMGFFLLDPVPNLIVHPVACFQIGYNSMIYSYKQADSSNAPTPLSPYFYGLIIKASADALYNLGEHSSIFLGLEYQWADTKTTSNTNGEFDKRDMSGIGIRAGFRVVL
jgi:hypothetical protein